VVTARFPAVAAIWVIIGVKLEAEDEDRFILCDAHATVTAESILIPVEVRLLAVNRN
jgi:hypothetical protein